MKLPKNRKRVAVVSGGGCVSDGIGNGRAAAILFAREDCDVVVVDVFLKRAQKTVEMIKVEGGSAISIEANVLLSTDCKRVVRETLKKFGKIDFLDNNIGLASDNLSLTETKKGWENIIKNNIDSILKMTRAVVPAMKKNNSGGSIVNIGTSIIGARAVKMSSYAIIKSLVIELTKSLAIDLAKDNIRVNCVSPGPIYTPMACYGGMSKKRRQERENSSPLKVEGTGWDVGNAVVFLCSEQAKYITGENINVDGGIHLTGPFLNNVI
jgi:NAD(P)-dependent dehydrogenase (short-subunit alcohol dehydrogenase family)